MGLIHYSGEGSGRRGRTMRLQCGLPAHHKTFPTGLTYEQSPDQQRKSSRPLHDTSTVKCISVQTPLPPLSKQEVVSHCFTSDHHFIYFKLHN